MSARLGLDEVGDLFGIELEDEDVDSVGGLLGKALGRVPQPGATADYEGLVMTGGASRGRGRGIATVFVERSAALDGGRRERRARTPHRRDRRRRERRQERRMMPSEPTADFRSGFVTFVGRPNVGKSTLTNALVGEKVAITSDKPQTTRRAIRGILNRPDGQLVIVDTPGIHRPRTLLGERLNHLVEQVLGDVDVIGFCVPATEKVGPGDRRIAESLDGYRRAKKVAIVTKTDAASREQITERLLEVDALREDWAAVDPAVGAHARAARRAHRRAARR